MSDRQGWLHFHNLRVGQAVEVRRGTLQGMTGVLRGFGTDHRCIIHLNTVEGGVSLIIDPAAIVARPLVETTN